MNDDRNFVVMAVMVMAMTTMMVLRFCKSTYCNKQKQSGQEILLHIVAP